MKPIYSGKVREVYDVSNEHLVIVTTDRISAFDSILPVFVKNKGIVLNKLSNFWFNKTKGIVKNHIVDDNIKNMPDYFHDEAFADRTVMVQKLKMFPCEFVVRGYIFGSMWNAYEKGEAFCGNIISGNYKMAQKLEQPIITPAIKHDDEHDVYVDIKTIESMIGKDYTNQIVKACFDLYKECSNYALSKGIIIADAKFEFGLNAQGEIVLADEIFTPDASRFWDAKDYKVGESPKSYDKQFLRDWLLNNKVNNEFQFSNVPEEVLSKTGEIYQECLNRITH